MLVLAPELVDDLEDADVKVDNDGWHPELDELRPVVGEPLPRPSEEASARSSEPRVPCHSYINLMLVIVKIILQRNPTHCVFVYVAACGTKSLHSTILTGMLHCIVGNILVAKWPFAAVFYAKFTCAHDKAQNGWLLKHQQPILQSRSN